VQGTAGIGGLIGASGYRDENHQQSTASILNSYATGEITLLSLLIRLLAEVLVD
jgi:hypothetical protein